LFLTGNISEAFNWAMIFHGGAKRKGTSIPYISHLMAVASIVMENTADEDIAIAALLHDAAEDAGGKSTLLSIRSRFGDRVAQIVADCSDTFETPKPEYRPRKAAYVAGLKDKHVDSQLVSLADKVHNMKSILRDYCVIQEELWERFNADRDTILWHYDELLVAFRTINHTEHKVLVDELERDFNILKELIAER